MSLLAHALEYHRLGFPLVPLIRGTKAPYGAAWNALRSSPQTEDDVRSLFSSRCNIGLLTGGPGGIVGIDQDVKKGKQGPAQWDRYKADHGITEQTRQHRSPSGGVHDLYRLPPGVSIPTRLACHLFNGGPSGIDVMAGAASHSNLVLPPSALIGDTFRGKPQTPGPYTVACDLPVRPIPPVLLEALLSLPPVNEKSGDDAVTWTAIDEKHPEWAARVEAQREIMARESLYHTGEGLGGFRYVLFLQRAGAGLLLPQAETLKNFYEVYNPRLPEAHQWTAQGDHDALERIADRADALEADNGNRPDQTWQEIRGRQEQLVGLQSAMSRRDWGVQDTSRATSPATSRATSQPPAEPEEDTWGVIDWTANDPPVAWLVAKIIQEATVSVAFGLPNSLKTWTCYLLALAVASGRPWLGRPTRQGRVVILDYESSARQARRRMRLLKSLGVDMRDVRYINPTERLDDPKLWDRVAKLKPTLVVVDSLTRGMLGLNENAVEMQIPLDLAKRMARACGASTVFIHHKNKSGKEGQAGIRGSTAIYAAAEGALEFLDFVRVNADVQRARLHCDRLKESTAFEDIHLELSDAAGLIEVPAASPVGREELTEDGVKPRILLHAQSNPNLGQEALLRKAGLSNGKRKLGAQALKELVSEGRIVRTSRGTGHVYSVPASSAEQDAAVLLALLAGLSATAEILRHNPVADLETFTRLALADLIVKHGGAGWGLTEAGRDAAEKARACPAS